MNADTLVVTEKSLEIIGNWLATTKKATPAAKETK
jgi:hypothetical protein